MYRYTIYNNNALGADKLQDSDEAATLTEAEQKVSASVEAILRHETRAEQLIVLAVERVTGRVVAGHADFAAPPAKSA